MTDNYREPGFYCSNCGRKKPFPEDRCSCGSEGFVEVLRSVRPRARQLSYPKSLDFDCSIDDLISEL